MGWVVPCELMSLILETGVSDGQCDTFKKSPKVANFGLSAPPTGVKEKEKYLPRLMHQCRGI
jgi:hypothetical protein